MCGLVSELLDFLTASARMSVAREGHWVELAVALAGCCDLRRLSKTGLLVPAQEFLPIPNMHSVVAPLLVRLEWECCKVWQRI